MEDDLVSMRLYLHNRQLDFPVINLKVPDKIDPKDIETLTGWLIEVVDEYEQTSQTFHLSCFYIIRYLTTCMEKYPRSKLQLISMAALLIASKMESHENHVTVDMLVYISDNAFSKSELIEMEANMLRKLQYVLANPTIYEFAEQYADLIGKSEDARFKRVLNYLVDLVIARYNSSITGLPSHIALACITLAEEYCSQITTMPLELLRFNDEKVKIVVNSLRTLVENDTHPNSLLIFHKTLDFSSLVSDMSKRCKVVVDV